MLSSKSNQRNAVIRVAAYHRSNFDVALIWLTLSEYNIIRSFINKPFPSTALSNISLGNAFL